MTRIVALLVITATFMSACPSLAQSGKDMFGDPLPEGAKARLGVARLAKLDTYTTPNLSSDGQSLIAAIRGQFHLVDYTTGESKGLFGKGRQMPVIISTDGRRVVSTMYGGIKVWNLLTGDDLCEIKSNAYFGSHRGSFSISADGKRLAIMGSKDSAKKDSKVNPIVWDVDSNKELVRFEVIQNQSGYVAITPDGKSLITWGDHYDQPKPGETVDYENNPRNQFQIWDIETKKERSKTALLKQPQSVAITPDSKFAVMSSGDGLIQFYDIQTGKLTRELIGHNTVGNLLTISPDGKSLASSNYTGMIQIWDLKTGQVVSQTRPPVPEQNLSIYAIRFTGEHKAVVLAQSWSTKLVWEVPSGKLLTPRHGHFITVNSVAFTNNDKELLTASQAGDLLRWSTDGKLIGPVSLNLPGGQSYSSYQLTLSSNGKYAWRAESISSNYAAYDITSGNQLHIIPALNTYQTSVHHSQDFQRVVTLNPPGYSAKVKLHKLFTLDMTREIKIRSQDIGLGDVQTQSATPDGKYLIITQRKKNDKESNKDEKVISTLDTETGKVIASEPISQNFGISRVLVHPDGQSVVLFDSSKSFTVYSVPALKSERKIENPKSELGEVHASPVFNSDGSLLVVPISPSYSANSGTVVVFDWKTGTMKKMFQGHNAGVSTVAISSDSKWIASGSQDSTVLIWELSK